MGLTNLETLVTCMARGRTAIGKPCYNKTRANASGEEEASLRDQIKGSHMLQYLENSDDSQALCIGEDRGRDDLVGTKGLSRINEAGHDESDTMNTCKHTETEGGGGLRSKNPTDFPGNICVSSEHSHTQDKTAT